MRSAFPMCLVFMALFAPGCSRQAPKGVMDEDTFVRGYSEMSVIAEHDRDDSLRLRRRLDSLYRSIGANRDDIQRSLDWYAQDKNRWEDVNKKVISRLEERLRRLTPPPPAAGEKPSR